MLKTILITGSTDGIGKLSAIKFADGGDEIILHGRSQDKLNSAISEIKETSKNENVKGFVSDFSDLDSVKQMAAQIKSKVSKIDVLVNNAGIYKSPNSSNKNGYNIQFAVNYLAPYLLTKELIPLTQKGNDPRIINLSSAAQLSVSLKVLTDKKQLSANDAYAQSKLALTMWSFYLAKQLKDVSVIALNPGSLLNTKMVKEAFGRHWSPVDKGADIIYNLSVSEKFMDVTGKYFDNDKGYWGDAHKDSYDEMKIEMLIEATEKILEYYK